MNVRHVAQYRFRFFRQLRWAITRFFLKFRFGRWHCTVCGTDCGRLLRPRTKVDQWEFKPRPERDNPERDSRLNKSDKSDGAAQPVGNFLLQERSMAAKQERTFPFTDKFRESIIERLLNGHVTIREIRDELHLSEADLLSWIDDCLQQKQRRIEELTALLTALQPAHNNKLGHHNDTYPSGATPPPVANGPNTSRQVFTGEVLPPTPKR